MTLKNFPSYEFCYQYYRNFKNYYLKTINSLHVKINNNIQPTLCAVSPGILHTTLWEMSFRGPAWMLIPLPTVLSVAYQLSFVSAWGVSCFLGTSVTHGMLTYTLPRREKQLLIVTDITSPWDSAWCFGHCRIWLFCDTVNCSQPGSSVRGISQARILE